MASRECEEMRGFFNQLTRRIEALPDVHIIADLTRPPVQGLTDWEMSQVRTRLGFPRLPAYYEEFLRRMGRSAGWLLSGTNMFYPYIVDAAAEARELLSENSADHLIGPESVIFATHQGYVVYWMETYRHDDPAVMRYTEGDQGPGGRWDRFSLFLDDELTYSERWRSDRPQSSA